MNLNLKVLAEWDEDVFGLFEICLAGDASHVHCQCNGKIKRVKGGFISDDKGMLFKGEFGEVDAVFWGGEEVEKLTQFRLVGCLHRQPSLTPGRRQRKGGVRWVGLWIAG